MIGFINTNYEYLILRNIHVIRCSKLMKRKIASIDISVPQPIPVRLFFSLSSSPVKPSVLSTALYTCFVLLIINRVDGLSFRFQPDFLQRHTTSTDTYISIYRKKRGEMD